MIQAVLFDIGGTLHKNENPPGRDVQYAARLLERLRDYDIDLGVSPEFLAKQLHENSEEYKHFSEDTLRELPQAQIWNDYYLKQYRIGLDRIAPIAEELSFRYDYDRVRVIRRPNLVETITELKNMGMRLGVISNIISASVVPHFLKEYGIEDFMECVVMSSVCGVRKPGAEIFRVAERAMNLKPEDFAYVGDTLSRDVRGVRNAGWHTMIQIRNPSISHRDVGMAELGYKPDYLIDDLSEIPAIIRKENGQA